MRQVRRLVLPALCATLLAACGKQAADNGAPLAFVPADTPFAYANIEPTPTAITEGWSKRMQAYWPALMQMYQGMLARVGAEKNDPDSARAIKIGIALLDEFKTDDLWTRLRQMGLKPDARFAVYGVGMVPVIRAELADPAAFKKEVATIEEKVGEKIPTGRVGDQDYWRIGDEHVVGVAAIEGNHLVLTLLPTNADDALKQTILGLTRPAQNLGDAGTLQAIARQYNYSAYGTGFIDFVRLTERFSNPAAGTDADVAKAIGLPLTGADPACRADYLEIAHKFPRFVAGVEELSTQRVRLGAQMEIDPSIAQPLSAAFGAAPGTGATGEGVMDISVSLPILKLKDFWVKQAEAVAAKPYTCSQLTSLNEGFASSRAKVDVTVPPPFSDLTGVRFTLDNFAMQDGASVPEVSGKMMMRTTNPVAVLAMAQLAVPQLAALKVQPDGKAVALPLGVLPVKTPPLSVAMSSDALAISSGAGEDATLGAYLAEPAAKDPVFMRMHFTGKMYGLMSDMFNKFKAMMPPDRQADIDMQTKVFAAYEQWLKSGDFTFVANPNGIAIHEVVEQN
ncbi:MAG TPA: hypothetical protein VHW73_07775 [Rudaea sp.]|jgi:hypothetical protein|nr:hypothetical protein [Rudaea sp.]